MTETTISTVEHSQSNGDEPVMLYIQYAENTPHKATIENLNQLFEAMYSCQLFVYGTKQQIHADFETFATDSTAIQQVSEGVQTVKKIFSDYMFIRKFDLILEQLPSIEADKQQDFLDDQFLDVCGKMLQVADEDWLDDHAIDRTEAPFTPENVESVLAVCREKVLSHSLEQRNKILEMYPPADTHSPSDKKFLSITADMDEQIFSSYILDLQKRSYFYAHEMNTDIFSLCLLTDIMKVSKSDHRNKTAGDIVKVMEKIDFALSVSEKLIKNEYDVQTYSGKRFLNEFQVALQTSLGTYGIAFSETEVEREKSDEYAIKGDLSLATTFAASLASNINKLRMDLSYAIETNLVTDIPTQGLVEFSAKVQEFQEKQLLEIKIRDNGYGIIDPSIENYVGSGSFHIHPDLKKQSSGVGLRLSTDELKKVFLRGFAMTLSNRPDGIRGAETTLTFAFEKKQQ